jgi:hypothetical protein
MMHLVSDPSKAAPISVRRAVIAGLWIAFGVVWFFALSPAVGAVWIVCGSVWVWLAWRARRGEVQKRSAR